MSWRKCQKIQFTLLPVCGLFAQVGRQVDDGDGLERAFFDTNTTTDTQLFGNGCDLVIGSDFYTQLSHADDGTWFFALLPTSFRLALIIIYNGDSSLSVGLIGFFSFQFGRHFEGEILLQEKLPQLFYTRVCFSKPLPFQGVTRWLLFFWNFIIWPWLSKNRSGKILSTQINEMSLVLLCWFHVLSKKVPFSREITTWISLVQRFDEILAKKWIWL